MKSHAQGGPDEDQELVDRAQGGDTDAFGELVRKYQHRAVNFARVMLTSAAEAEDVAQEAFVRAYRGLRQFRGASSFKTWFYQIVANTARTDAGRSSRRRERQEDDDGRDGERLASREDVEQATIDRDRLDRALASLSPELREAVLLRDVEGLDYREIAVALGVPIGTVESRIFRGRARLRAFLTEPS